MYVVRTVCVVWHQVWTLHTAHTAPPKELLVQLMSVQLHLPRMYALVVT